MRFDIEPQRIRSSVYDPRDEVMVFNDDITTITEGDDHVVFVCFVSNPTGSQRLFNLSIRQWLPTIEWHGNVLVVAREAASLRPIDFTDELLTSFKYFLTRCAIYRRVHLTLN